MPRVGERIASVHNPLVRRFRRVLEGKDRDAFVLEGVRLLEDAVAAGTRFEAVLVSPRLEATERGRALRDALPRSGARIFPAADEVVARASEVETHQGIVALAPLPDWKEGDLFPAGRAPFLVVVAGVREPGNLGAVLRVAEGAGATGAVVSEGSAWPFQDRCARATAGAILRVPVIPGLAAREVVSLFSRRGLRAVAADPKEGEDYRRADLGGPLALLLGSEARGLPGELRRAADLTVRIPLQGRLESLNVAAAAAILCFEVARRRDGLAARP